MKLSFGKKKKRRIIFWVLRTLVFVILSVLIYMQAEQRREPHLINLLWLLSCLYFMWFGNTLLTWFLDTKLTWEKNIKSRFVTQLVISLFYSLLIINLSYLIFKSYFTDTPPILSQVITLNFYGILVVLPVFAFYFGFHFVKAWQNSKIESEKYQKESVKSQLESLKNHLDPHFLFNNLNILSSLIDKDTEGSKEYLNKFAEVYRFMLRSNSSELVSLSKELEFAEAYLHLLKTRFSHNFNVDFQIPKKNSNHHLPPLTIQMLLENCVKHNIVSKDKPLNIQVKCEGDGTLSVSNTLQKKKIANNHKSGSGLDNIMTRYKYFTNKPVEIIETSESFKVKVPLIEIEEA